MTRISFTLLPLVLVVGCGKNDTPSKPSQPTVSATQKPAAEPNLHLPELHRAFKDAALIEPPVEVNRPPDKTVAGKIVGKLYDQIVGTETTAGLWNQIRFVTADGKRIDYTALVRTRLGEIQITLLADVAPNHVRNFICLAKVGYYDGLSFDRIIRQEIDGKPLRAIEGGCPLGTGEAGSGHIGYWLLPEISKKVRHEEGMLGASHAEALETAACKFYITLSPAPWMDDNYTLFGKVTRGLDVVRAIFDQPVLEEGFRDRPRDPVKIDSVIIQANVDVQ